MQGSRCATGIVQAWRVCRRRCRSFALGAVGEFESPEKTHKPFRPKYICQGPDNTSMLYFSGLEQYLTALQWRNAGFRETTRYSPSKQFPDRHGQRMLPGCFLS